MEHDQQYNHSVAEVAGQSLIIPGTARAIGAIIQLRIHARDVFLALKRPEQISIRNILEVRITEIIEQPDQAYMQVHLDLNDHRLLSHLTWSAVAELGLQAGQGVYALIKGSHLKLTCMMRKNNPFILQNWHQITCHISL